MTIERRALHENFIFHHHRITTRKCNRRKLFSSWCKYLSKYGSKLRSSSFSPSLVWSFSLLHLVFQRAWENSLKVHEKHFLEKAKINSARRCSSFSLATDDVNDFEGKSWVSSSERFLSRRNLIEKVSEKEKIAKGWIQPEKFSAAIWKVEWSEQQKEVKWTTVPAVEFPFWSRLWRRKNYIVKLTIHEKTFSWCCACTGTLNWFFPFSITLRLTLKMEKFCNFS